MPQVDINVDDEGSVFLFSPITPLAREWVATNLSLEGWQWLGRAFAVEHRFVAPIVEGMMNDGLRVG
ncbi:MAG: hypothetical protein NT031_19315 [Planctomycetota bacterium]|nr:hypothetical protein [Planctomycetota bacterium]